MTHLSLVEEGLSTQGFPPKQDSTPARPSARAPAIPLSLSLSLSLSPPFLSHSSWILPPPRTSISERDQICWYKETLPDESTYALMDDERRNKCDLCSNGRRKTFCSISKFCSLEVNRKSILHFLMEPVNSDPLEEYSHASSPTLQTNSQSQSCSALHFCGKQQVAAFRLFLNN
ncbi:hypothetical protein QQF64_013432 [Cirrhinus molitorella]|uniref:Uncharacterized protein n=1 Tax=Cirrhinus molitorella TaxID=172907 RepID=A0ABR3LTR9_9TELE